MKSTILQSLLQFAAVRPRTFADVSGQALWIGFLLTSFICGSGCTAVQARREHVVLVSRSGKSMSPEGPKARKAYDFGDHLRTVTNAIANCTNCVGVDRTKRILIFVHGGLNTYNQSLKRVEELVPKISTNSYPLFINWNSGFLSSYREHLFITRQGQVARVWGPVTSPFYLAADLGRAITRAPVVWFHQLTSDATTAIRYETPKILRKALFGQSTSQEGAQRQSDNLQISPGDDNRRTLNQVLYGTSYFVTLPVKLAVAPFIDALGKSAWDNLSRRTQTMFWDPTIFKSPKRGEEIKIATDRIASQPGGSGIVAQLIQCLADLIESDKANHRYEYEITLIGHSMGTIVANEIIRTHPELPYRNIVYMGAACSVSDFEKTVVPYLRTNNNAQFYNLTLHPIAEAREAQWSLLDIPPRGSLLAWIDNFLSSPRTVPERTLGKWENVVSTSVLIPQEIAGRVHIKAFDVGGNKEARGKNPQKHGAFSEQDFWEEKFWQ